MTQGDRETVIKEVEHCHACVHHRSRWPKENGPCDYDGPCFIGREYEGSEWCDDFEEAPK
jgi:hypothetical protein